MDKSQKLAVLSDRLVSLVVRHASVGNWRPVQIYEKCLLRCRRLISECQTPGF